MGNRKVLVIEDEQDIAELLALHLRDLNCEVTLAADGHEGMRQAFARNWDLVILDLRLPGPDGLSICRALRRESRYVPILMLTSKSSELDRVLGLELGADDYVTKPFSVKVLLERIKARKRRRGDAPLDEVTSCQEISIDRSRHRVTASGTPIQLTHSEFRLLEALIRQPGRVFQRSELIDAALGGDTLVMERTIDVHVRALRRKLGEHADVIETVRGVGYRFRDPQTVAQSANYS
jgi:two-component system phosphate regulon response regulator PhoB